MFILDRKARDRKLRRSDILQAAERLFAEKGYHKTTIRDIAKQAQYAAGTIYLYFKDKDEIYFSLFEEKMQGLLKHIVVKVDAVETSRDKIASIVHGSLEFLMDNRDFLRIFVLELGEISAEKKLLESAIEKQHDAYMLDLFRQAQGEGVLRKDFDPKQIKDIFIAIIKTITIKSIMNEDIQTKENVCASANAVLELFFHGVAQNKPV
jgi:AcrR family transcriptional regulator